MILIASSLFDIQLVDFYNGMKYGFEQNKENWIVNAQHVLTTIGLSYTKMEEQWETQWLGTAPLSVWNPIVLVSSGSSCCIVQILTAVTALQEQQILRLLILLAGFHCICKSAIKCNIN